MQKGDVVTVVDCFWKQRGCEYTCQSNGGCLLGKIGVIIEITLDFEGLHYEVEQYVVEVMVGDVFEEYLFESGEIVAWS